MATSAITPCASRPWVRPTPTQSASPTATHCTPSRWRWGRPVPDGCPVLNDTDVFRFSLSATERIRIHLDVPADGAVGVRLYNGDGTDFAGFRSASVGVPYTYEGAAAAG